METKVESYTLFLENKAKWQGQPGSRYSTLHKDPIIFGYKVLCVARCSLNGIYA